MKTWLKEYKWKIVRSTLLTTLPMLMGLILWNRLPDVITTHWGVDGVADGFSGKAFAVFGLPAIMAALNVLCCVATAIDPKQAVQNKKAMSLVFWMMPIISVCVSTFVYSAAIGKAMDMLVVMPLLMGVMFVWLGNYMPKIKQNSTLGIKIYWTLYNEENWNKTHRLGGKVSVAAGIVTMLSALLPIKWMVTVMITAMFVIIIVPMAYSYRIYRRHKREGIAYFAPVATKKEKTAKWVSIIMVLVILAGVAVVMFTGDITYTCHSDKLQIEASYHEDIVVSYGKIDAIELREDFDIGVRAMGFGSVRLSMGNFRNDEFKAYTLYCYNSCDSMILIRSGEKVLAINCQTTEETLALYQTILAKMG